MLEADIEMFLLELWRNMKENEDILDSFDDVVAAEWRVRSSSQTLVSYDIFRSQYWDHFSQTLAKGLGTSLIVFSSFLCKLIHRLRLGPCL
jgi:hypothetical protein